MLRQVVCMSHTVYHIAFTSVSLLAVLNHLIAHFQSNLDIYPQTYTPPIYDNHPKILSWSSDSGV